MFDPHKISNSYVISVSMGIFYRCG